MSRPRETELTFSLKEAAVLSRLPEDKLRREVERGIIKPQVAPAGSAHRLQFEEPEILYCAMVNSFSDTLELTPRVRTRVWRLLVTWQPRSNWRRRIIPADKLHFDWAKLKAWTMVHEDAEWRRVWVETVNREWSRSINPVITVDWKKLVEEVGPRIELYRKGLARISEDKEVLGGEPVFDGTRLAVRHIGGMRAKGEPVQQILADYPDLTADDVEFARLYAEAHPPVGRPKSSAAI